MRFAIDFDGVIHDYKHPIKKMGGPIMGAEDALEDLIQEGHTVIIHSVKANTPSGRKAIEDWLEYFDIPYTEIVGKPDADYYIDDKAIVFTDWKPIIERFEAD